MALTKPSSVSGSTFFKPADYSNAVALLFEPTSLRENVPSTDFQGNPTTEDQLTARLTVFATQDQLDKGEPAEVVDVTVTHKALVNPLKTLVPDGAMAGIVRKRPGKSGNSYWSLSDLDFDTEQKVGAYYEASNADVPDYLK